MKRKILLLALMVGGAFGVANAEQSADLISNFDTPPMSARPLVRWWWLDRQSEESITRDLEALKEQGGGGMILYACDGSILPEDVFGPRKMYWTPEWLEMVNHATAEAKRLGLDLFINQVGTSSGSGGPGISIEESGKKIVWSPAWVSGGSNVTVQLPCPETFENYYRDVSVIAYPCENKWGNMLASSPKLTASTTEFKDRSVGLVLDGDTATHWSSDINTPKGEYIDISFNEPFKASAVYIVPRNGWTPSVIDVQVSADGIHYTRIQRQTMFRDESVTVKFKVSNSRFYRIGFPSSYNPTTRIGVAELRLLSSEDPSAEISPFETFSQQIASARVSSEGRDVMLRAGDQSGPKVKVDTVADSVMDISQYMNADGVLNWDAPAGNWMVLRFGQTSIGRHMHVNTGIGYHVDYLNPDSVRKHFKEEVDRHLLDGINPETRSALTGIYEDSFEMPFNTWTEAFADEFEQRRGYEILPWLPVLAGRVVNSKAESERFLWDYRRTIADLYMTHWGTVRELCHERGLPFMAQAAGPQAYNFDALSQLGRTDIPMGEFWSGIYRPGVPVDEQHRGSWGNPVCETVKQASSAAHIYGRPVVACESFTGYARPFVTDWFDIKAFGDRALCDGLNRFAIHLFMSQPREEVNGKPCVVRTHGIDFNRRATWWEQAGEWTGYLSRCSTLLQAGTPVADVVYYVGEGAPAFVSPREFIQPPIPDGYDYDGCNLELLLKAKVKDGRVMFPSGASYAVLTLPPATQAMSPKVLEHLMKLVKKGAVVLGPKPTYSPSLYQHEKTDAKVRKLADKLWGTSTKESDENIYGKGRVLWGKTVQEALIAASCESACTITGADSILFIQRHTDEGELFFLSQQDKKAVDFSASFKVDHSVIPELWDPATGKRDPIAVFKQVNGRVDIPLHLDARGSVFVVLKPGTPDAHVTSVQADGVDDEKFTVVKEVDSLKLISSAPGTFRLKLDSGETKQITVPSVPSPIDLSNDWNLTFEGIGQTITMDNLISWTELESEEQRNYSGAGIYRKQFSWSGTIARVELDLGRLKNIAEVTLNGTKVGLLWKPPYRLDISSALVPGENKLEIEVINLLVNRITGDMLLPEEERSLKCFGAIDQYLPGVESGQDTVLPSGLFGPVVIFQPAVALIHDLSKNNLSSGM